MVYTHPIDIQKYSCDNEPIYEIDSNMVKLKVTMNHRMWVKPRTAENYRIELAEDIVGKRRQYKKNVNHICIDEDSKYINKYRQFILPGVGGLDDITLDMKSFLTLLGIWIAEGCITGNGWALDISAHKQRVKDALEIACEKMGFNIRKHIEKNNIRDKWRLTDKRLVSFFKPLSVGAVNKFLPEFVWQLWYNEARWLIDGMMLGDGHTMKNGTRRYDTSSKKLADDFQILCLYARYSTNITVKYEAGRETVIKAPGREGEIIKSTATAYRMTIIEKQNNPLVNKSKKLDKIVNYTGDVYCCSVMGDGVIYVRHNGYPVWCGNSRHGQKGTIGITMEGIDMPFTKHGLRPDIIMNPNAIPSRMTIGQLCECLFGKVGALNGMNMDSTAFEDYDIESVKDVLEQMGYHREGTEYLYNGMNGAKLKHMIFIGPTYYQRLKHMVIDKIHSRARGPTTALTRQAPEGRARDGGLRLGEMERDALIAHGMAKFLKERLMECSDAYCTYVCGICGLFARREDSRYNRDRPEPTDVYYCPMCKNYNDIHKVMIPYAFKLMIQELMAMCIAPRIIIQKQICR